MLHYIVPLILLISLVTSEGIQNQKIKFQLFSLLIIISILPVKVPLFK